MISFSFLADEVNLLANVSLNLTKHLRDVLEILPDEEHTLEATIFPFDEGVNSTLKQCDFKWEISSVDKDTGQFFPLVELLERGRNITISSKHITEGLTFVRVTVRPKELSGPVSYGFGFIKILPQLTAMISGPDVVVKGGGAVQLFSVTKGELQDSFGDKAANVTFMWSCKLENSMSSNLSLPFDSTFDKNEMNTSKRFGCYPRILKSTGKRSLVLKPDFFISRRTYVFHALVSQGRRFVTATHKLRVETNISFAIR